MHKKFALIQPVLYKVWSRKRCDISTETPVHGTSDLDGSRQVILWVQEEDCNWMKILLIAVFGALGTLARYYLGGYVQRAAGGAFPWGTFAANMAGCFLFGLVWTLAEDRLIISGETRAVILIGFMGAFTTYSTFMFETGALFRDAEWALAFGNIALQNCCGLLFLFLGLTVGRAV